MPRKARLVLPGYLHHITQRGNYRQPVFDDDEDRIIYLKYVDEYCKKYQAEVYAYCLMDNHVHFIVKPHQPESLARAFNVAHQRYAYYYHKKNKQQGHLWQARFYSCVLSGEHAYEAMRYVERNPVRANIVASPWDYQWSSARNHLGKKCQWLQLSDIKEYIETKCWKDFLNEPESNEMIKKLREATRQCIAVGSQEFIEEWEQKLGRSLCLKIRGRPFKNKSGCHL